MAPDPSFKDLANELRDLLAATPGDEGMSQGELSEALGWGRERTLKGLKLLLTAGKLEVGRGKRMTIAGTNTLVPVYRLKK